MGACRYVGRVGGLAVALGVGLAIANGAAVASADETGATSSEDSSTEAHATKRTGDRDGKDAAAAKAADDSAEDESADDGSAARSHAGKRGRDQDTDIDAVETRTLTLQSTVRDLPEPADPVTPVDFPAQMVFLGAGSRTRALEVHASGSTAPVMASVQSAAATRVTVAREIRRSGIPTTQTLMTADGSRALVTTSARGFLTGGTTRVAVVDTATGRQIDSGLRLSGGPFWGSAPLSADGTHALVTTQSTGWLTGKRTQAAVIDLVTGRRVGATITLNGLNEGFPLLSTDRSRALITASDSTAGGTSRRFAVINMVTGTQTGATFTLADDQASATPVMSANGLRVLFTTNSYVEATQTSTTKVTVVDTTTGSHATVAVDGAHQRPWGSSPLNADGTRALVTTLSTDEVANVHTARLAVINTDSVTSTVLSVVDDEPPSIVLSPNRSRALIVRQVIDPVTALDKAEVTVIDGASGSQAGASVTLRSDQPAELTFSPDETRVVVSTRFVDAVGGPTSQITVLNAISGTRVHDPLTFEGDRSANAVFSPDGARALISSYGGGAGGFQVAVVSMNTGAQIGAPLNFDGRQQAAAPVFSPDGTRILLLSNGSDGTTAAVIDASTGAQVGSAVPLEDYPYPFESASFSTDGARVVVTTGSSGIGPNATRVAVIDTRSGTKVGTSLLVAGVPTGRPATVIAGGTRAFVSTSDFTYAPPNSTYVMRVAVVDTATGIQVGTSLAQKGDNLGSTALSADGSRVVVTTPAARFGSRVTLVAVFDTATGEQIGPTLTRTGREYAAPVLDSDGKRALITTYASGTTRVAVLQIG